MKRFRADHGPNVNPTYGYVGLDDDERGAYAHRDLFKYMVHTPATVQTVRRDGAKLDRDAYELVRAPTAVSREELALEGTKERYLRECADHVRAITGAPVAIPFDYVMRTATAFGEDEFKKRGTYCCCRPHNDHTFASASKRIRDLLPAPYDELFARSRHAIVNAWRRWDGGNAWPLACATYDNVDMERDLIECDLIYKHRTGHSFNVSNQSNIVYNFFQDQGKDDLLVFKIADTEHAKGCVHTAIDNKDAPDDPPRVSVEARFILLWDEEVARGMAAGGVDIPVSHNIVSKGFAVHGPGAKA